ncbi:MAG: hypothetical protein ACKOEM_08260 [Planctomycetia bacterium]
MPATLDQLEAFFVAKRLKYRREPDHLVAGFATKQFHDENGRSGVAIVIRLDEGGKYLELVAPGLYRSHGCRHKAALFQALLDVTLRTKMIRFEHDPADGEIRCSVEFPIEDGTLTAKQFHRMLECLAESVDRWHPVIRRAIDEGFVTLDCPEPEPAAASG